MSVEYIDSPTQFNTKFNQFKENSEIQTSPAIYHIGLDCEYITESNFPHSYAQSTNWINKSTYGIAICCIQIANSKECLVIDVTKFNKVLPKKLIEILTSGNWLKTGVGIDLDMQYIQDNFSLPQCNGVLDMRTHAILSGVNTPSLEHLSGISKNENISGQRDWSQPISLQQLKYAGSDGFCSYNVGKQFLKISLNAFKNKTTITYKDIVDKESLTLITQTLQKNKINYVGILQEYVMSHASNRTSIELPIYTDYEADKKTHLFAVECKIKGVLGHGVGQNKMTAKQNSAKVVYEKLLDLEQSLTNKTKN